MRKLSTMIVLTSVIGFLVQPLAYSASNYAVNSCPAKPYPVSNIATRGLQGIFGLNYIARKKAEGIIKDQLSKNAMGVFDVDLDTYSAMDLAAGKMKGLKIKGKNVAFNDIYISSIEAESLCDFIHLNYKSNPIKPLAPLFVGFKGTITENDINNTLNSKTVQDKISKVKISLMNVDVNLATFKNLRANIQKNKIFISADMHIAGMPKFVTVPLKIGASPEVVNGKIKLTDIEIPAKGPMLDFGFTESFIETISPILFDLDSLKKNGAYVTIKKMAVQNNKLDLEGTVWMPNN